MSAIWGAVDFSKEIIKQELITKMEQPYYRYKIDRFESQLHENILMGCGIQYITEEAVNEVLPIYDSQRNLYFTADCILNNRNELLELLAKEYGFEQSTPDGRIIYGAYLKWGEACAEHLRGMFSFVIYDAKKNLLLIYADQVSERCIYYCRDDEGRLYFSTLLQPILAGLKNKAELNEEYITDSLGAYGLRVSLEPGYTPYKNIHKIEAGTFIRFTQDSMQVVRYWSPKNNKNLPPYESPEKSGEYCKKLLEAAVKDAMRCKGNIAGALSSGLDSSAVCGVAAKILAEDSRELNTYTFVPVPDYKFQGEVFYVADETPGVRKIAEMHTNLNPQFLDNRESNAYQDMDYFLDLLEIPYKSIANLPSINSLYRKAALDECKVFLYAQYGNVTLSLGNLEDMVYEKLKAVHLYKAFSIVSDFGLKYRIPRRRIFGDIIKKNLILPVNILKNKFKRNIFDKTYVNQQLAKKTGTEKKLRKLKYNIEINLPSDIREYRKSMYDLTMLAQLGELNTKFGLINGIVLRDPTKDISIIEYCSSLPMECFFHDSLGRWLIRGNMGEYVPEEVLQDVFHRGLQSADCLYKISKDWTRVFIDLEKCCNNPSLIKYINTQKVQSFLEMHREGLDYNDRSSIYPILYIAALSKFIDKHSNKN